MQQWLIDKLEQCGVRDDGIDTTANYLSALDLQDYQDYQDYQACQDDELQYTDSQDSHNDNHGSGYIVELKLENSAYRLPQCCDNLEAIDLEIIIPEGFACLTIEQQTAIMSIRYEIITPNAYAHRGRFISALLKTICKDQGTQCFTSDEDMQDHLVVRILDSCVCPQIFGNINVVINIDPCVQCQLSLKAHYIKSQPGHTDLHPNFDVHPLNITCYNLTGPPADLLYMDGTTMFYVYCFNNSVSSDIIGFMVGGYYIVPLSFRLGDIIFYVVPLSSDFISWRQMHRYLSNSVTKDGYLASLNKDFVRIEPIYAVGSVVADSIFITKYVFR